MFAALAALCFVAPPAVLAFGHGANTVRCLAHADAVDHGMNGAHGGQHHGDRSSPAGDHHMSCCGLFCLSALPADGGDVVGHADAAAALFPALVTSLLSRVLERLDRPPISLLIV